MIPCLHGHRVVFYFVCFVVVALALGRTQIGGISQRFGIYLMYSRQHVKHTSEIHKILPARSTTSTRRPGQCRTRLHPRPHPPRAPTARIRTRAPGHGHPAPVCPPLPTHSDQGHSTHGALGKARIRRRALPAYISRTVTGGARALINQPAE